MELFSGELFSGLLLVVDAAVVEEAAPAGDESFVLLVSAVPALLTTPGFPGSAPSRLAAPLELVEVVEVVVGDCLALSRVEVVSRATPEVSFFVSE